jgi:transposase-like protein
MNCPQCQSEPVIKRGCDRPGDGTLLHRYQCKGCGKRFNERSGPMARLRTPQSIVSYAISARTEGMGVRATGRTFGKSHCTIIRWENRLADPRESKRLGSGLKGAMVSVGSSSLDDFGYEPGN